LEFGGRFPVGKVAVWDLCVLVHVSGFWEHIVHVPDSVLSSSANESDPKICTAKQEHSHGDEMIRDISE
jgi:hypothetical protein